MVISMSAFRINDFISLAWQGPEYSVSNSLSIDHMVRIQPDSLITVYAFCCPFSSRAYLALPLARIASFKLSSYLLRIPRSRGDACISLSNFVGTVEHKVSGTAASLNSEHGEHAQPSS